MAWSGTILTATDLSPAAEAAVARATVLARQSGAARVDVLHVLSPSPLQALRRAARGGTADPETAARQAALAAVEQLAARLATPEIPLCPLVEVGRPHDQILRVATALGSGLIVVGAHGRHFVHQLLFGSTAERLLHRVQHPLLVVKCPDPQPYREVLVAVDFSDCSRQAASAATRLLPEADFVLYHAAESPFEGHLRLAAVTDEDIAEHRAVALGEARAEMARFARSVRAEAGLWRSRVEYGYPAARVETEIGRSQPDLLVLGKHGRSGIEQLLVGSVTSHLVRSVPCDVLVVPEAPTP